MAIIYSAGVKGRKEGLVENYKKKRASAKQVLWQNGKIQKKHV